MFVQKRNNKKRHNYSNSIVVPFFTALIGVLSIFGGNASAIAAPAPTAGSPSGVVCAGGQSADSQGNCPSASSSIKCESGTEKVTDSSGNSFCQDQAIYCKSNNCDIIRAYVNPFITFLSGIAGLIAVISLIMGGIQYSSSGGDPQKVAAAKKRVLNTIIAVVSFLFLYSFLQFLVPGGIFNR